MTPQHTPEPWAIQSHGLPEGLHGIIAPHHSKWFVAEDCKKVDAIRIVACVNACAGVDTETLVAMANGEMTGSELWELPKVKAERDRLAAQVSELEANLAHADAACADYKAQVAELLAALIEHQELTRPIQRTIEAIAKAGGMK